MGKWLLVSKNPEEQYLAGRLLEEKYLRPRDVGSEELFPRQYYEQAANKGYFAAKLRLVTEERWHLALKDRNHESDIAKLRELFKSHPGEAGEALGMALSDYVMLMKAQGTPASAIPDTAEERENAMCKSAEHGSVTAQYECGESLLRSGKAANKETAIKWLSRAAKQGHGLAAGRLVNFFKNGDKASTEKAKYWQCVADLNGGLSLAAIQYAH